MIVGTKQQLTKAQLTKPSDTKNVALFHIEEQLKVAAVFRINMERAATQAYYRLARCPNDVELKLSFEYAREVWKDALAAEDAVQEELTKS